jgi:hypothetical protein
MKMNKTAFEDIGVVTQCGDSLGGVVSPCPGSDLNSCLAREAAGGKRHICGECETDILSLCQRERTRFGLLLWELSRLYQFRIEYENSGCHIAEKPLKKSSKPCS